MRSKVAVIIMGFVTGGAQGLGGAEDSHWRGGGQSLEGRRTATGGALGRGQSLEGRRTVTGGAADSYWRGGGQLVTGMTDVPQGHRTWLEVVSIPPLHA